MSNTNNILHDSWTKGWRPNRTMILTKPFSKYPPVNYHNNTKVSWTALQERSDFRQTFVTDQLWRLEKGCNVAVIPTEKYWILDLDSGKVEAEIEDADQLEAYRLLESMALAYGLHIVETPNKGYHIYMPMVGELVTRTLHLPCVDVQFKSCYVLAPNSLIDVDGDKREYTVKKWSELSPDKAYKQEGGVNQHFLSALHDYIKLGEKPKTSVLTKTVVDNEIHQEVVSLDEHGNAEIFPDDFTDDQILSSEIVAFVSNAFRNPKFPNERYEIWGNYTNTYEKWRNLAHSLKSSAGRWLGDEKGSFEVFDWISNCSPKYEEPDGSGLIGRASCQACWDKQAYEPDKAEISYNGFRSRVLSDDRWALHSLDCFNKYEYSHLVGEVINEWVKTCIRLVYIGNSNKPEAYKINQKTQLWEASPGGLDIAWSKITKIFVKMKNMFCSYDFIIPIMIRPDPNKITTPKSVEEIWTATDDNADIQDMAIWELKDFRSFQRFKLRHWFGSRENSLENGANKANILMYLKAGLVDNEFANKKNSIPHLFPLSDAFNINLKTNQLEKRVAEDYFTMCSPCSSRQFLDAKSVDCRWFENKFISPMVGRNQENINYAMKMIGSSLCNEQVHHILGLIQGKGRNGKGYLLDALEFALGGFFHKLPRDYWSLPSNKSADAPSPSDFQCKGKRLIVMDEASDDATINTLTVKSMTGGGSITARPLHGAPETFTPGWTCLGVLNDLLKIDCVETSMKERLRIMKCNTRFFDEGHGEYDPENPDHAIGDKDIAKQARSGHLGSVIYNMAEGCRRYYTENMASDVPEDWIKDLEDYYSDKYPFNRFVKSAFVRSEGDYVETKSFKDIWAHWVRSPEYEGQEGALVGEYKLNKAGIIKKLTGEMGFKIIRKQVNGKREELLQDFKINPDFSLFEKGECNISELDL
jgi:phage/plasmid-associated DNA primase